jgi:hypothetical protein
LIFRLQTHKFVLRAVESVFFPPGKAGNTFRGALAGLLPESTSEGLQRPGGFADPPRPFVLRAAHLNGCVIEPGRQFEVGVNVFDLSGRTAESLEAAFAELGRMGLGPKRARVEVLARCAPADIAVDLAESTSRSQVVVRLETPTELKGMAAGASEIPFQILFERVRDRISALATIYGDSPLSVDFAAMGARAARVRTITSQLYGREIVRRSSRTGQTHGIGGLVGRVTYEGELGEFMPYLRAAWWTGVGRHTVWGNGVISCE